MAVLLVSVHGDNRHLFHTSAPPQSKRARTPAHLRERPLIHITDADTHAQTRTIAHAHTQTQTRTNENTHTRTDTQTDTDTHTRITTSKPHQNAHLRT